MKLKEIFKYRLTFPISSFEKQFCFLFVPKIWGQSGNIGHASLSAFLPQEKTQFKLVKLQCESNLIKKCQSQYIMQIFKLRKCQIIAKQFLLNHCGLSCSFFNPAQPLFCFVADCTKKCLIKSWEIVATFLKITRSWLLLIKIGSDHFPVGFVFWMDGDLSGPENW